MHAEERFYKCLALFKNFILVYFSRLIMIKYKFNLVIKSPGLSFSISGHPMLQERFGSEVISKLCTVAQMS